MTLGSIQSVKIDAPKKEIGLDGIPPLFYQHYWSLVGNCVTQVVLDFLNLGIVSPNFNGTHIVLIPKVKNPTKITQYCPISLNNVVFKVLANKLKHLFSYIINENQNALMSKCHITDNFLVTLETMHHLSQKMCGKVGETALKLNMSKVYDQVDCECLEKIMIKMGFHAK